MTLLHFAQVSLSVPSAPQTPRLHSIVQIACRQRAALDALALPATQRRMPRVRLAWARGKAHWGQAKREGKIKGPAPAWPQIQSARGFGSAPPMAMYVPHRHATPPVRRRCPVSFVDLCVGLSRKPRDDHA